MLILFFVSTFSGWESGWVSNQMEVPDVKIRNTAKDLTIGIGGHLIKDVTGNSHKGLVKKVRLEQIQD